MNLVFHVVCLPSGLVFLAVRVACPETADPGGASPSTPLSRWMCQFLVFAAASCHSYVLDLLQLRVSEAEFRKMHELLNGTILCSAALSQAWRSIPGQQQDLVSEHLQQQ